MLVRMGARTVLLVVYDGISLLDVSGPVEVFNAAARINPDCYQVRLASVGGRDVLSSSGVRLGVEVDLATVAAAPDILLIAGGFGYREAADDRQLIGQLRRLARSSRRVTSVCSGAFLLAAAGLLDGRRATTHWAYCAELAQRYQSVLVEPDSIFVRDGMVVTAAGVTAGVDLALTLVEEDHGAELARTIAKWLVVFLQRPGGQSQFSTWVRTRSPDHAALRRLLGEVTAEPAADHSIPAMARRLSTSTRHVSRLFAREVGVTPGRYVERARVEAARGLLETGPDGVETVARQCGFGTAETMRRAFLRQLGIPPSECRARFASTAAS